MNAHRESAGSERWGGARAVSSPLALACAVAASVVAGCGGDGDGDALWPVMPMSEVEAAADVVTVVATQVVAGLNEDDPSLFVSQFVDGGFVFDPIDPVRTPSVESYHPFEHGLCETWGLEEVFVNATGSLSTATCEGFFASIDGGPGSMDAVRHLPMSGGLATSMTHRLDVEEYGAYPEETVTIIGFSAGWADAVVEQVDVASAFRVALTDAWASGDPDRFDDLYTPEAVREDPFLGLPPDAGSASVWRTRLLDHYDTVTMSVERLFASALGPAAVYELVLTDADGECRMRQASVWNLDEDGLVTYEWVYYDRSTLNDCGWWG